MSTPAIIVFKDKDFGDVAVYQHWDGYPEGEHGVVGRVMSLPASGRVWDLPRYEGQEFAAGYVAAYKEGRGDIQILSGTKRKWKLTGCQYVYTVSFESGGLKVVVSDSWDGKPLEAESE